MNRKSVLNKVLNAFWTSSVVLQENKKKTKDFTKKKWAITKLCAVLSSKILIIQYPNMLKIIRRDWLHLHFHLNLVFFNIVLSNIAHWFFGSKYKNFKYLYQILYHNFFKYANIWKINPKQLRFVAICDPKNLKFVKRLI